MAAGATAAVVTGTAATVAAVMDIEAGTVIAAELPDAQGTVLEFMAA
jgi:hypothetical protein